jgi:hypothetical protein
MALQRAMANAEHFEETRAAREKKIRRSAVPQMKRHKFEGPPSYGDNIA